MASTKSIGNESAEKLDLFMREGADFGPYTISLTNPDGTPIDLAGVTVDAQARTSFNQPDPPPVSFVVSTDDPNGVITLSLPPSVTQTLAQRYVWDLRVTWVDNKVEVLLFGDVNVSRRVTR
jgi:hypothetical protein